MNFFVFRTYKIPTGDGDPPRKNRKFTTEKRKVSKMGHDKDKL